MGELIKEIDESNNSESKTIEELRIMQHMYLEEYDDILNSGGVSSIV